MVIPVSGEPPMGFGPLPPQLQLRLKRIKTCLVLLLVGLVAKLIGLLLLQPWEAGRIIIDSLDAMLVSLVGVFLLKDDPCFGKVHACIVQTCCYGCQEFCQGGITCLCTWFTVCLITALSDLWGDAVVVYQGVRLIFDPQYPDRRRWNFETRTPPWFICMTIFLAGLVLSLLAQLLGAWHGLKGCAEIQVLDPLEGGDWAAAGGDLAAGPLGVGPWGAQSGAAQAGGQPPQQEAIALGGPPEQRRMPPPPGFTPFSGTGQRLTD